MRLFAFDVDEIANPAFASEVDLSTNGWWGFSKPHLADKLLYLSHIARETMLVRSNSYVESIPQYRTETNIFVVTNITRELQSELITNVVLREQVDTTPVVVLGTNVIMQELHRTFFKSTLPLGAGKPIAVAAAAHHAFAVDESGGVWARGDNTFGNLGRTGSGGPAWLQVAGLPPVKQLAAGRYHTLALAGDGTVWSWGADFAGQLGAGDAPDSDLPPMPRGDRALALAIAGLSSVREIAAGLAHSVALDSNGSVWTWGANYFGELGTGDLRSRNTPQTLQLSEPVARITALPYGTLAIASNGRAYGSGLMEVNELALSTTNSVLVPVRAPNIEPFASVSGGFFHTLGLGIDGSVSGWGDSGRGQLGAAASTFSSPVPIHGLSNVKLLAAGDLHNLALDASGRVWAWGDNRYGQVTGAATDDPLPPEQLPVLQAATAIASGGAFSMALTADGTIWAWGENEYGQLGNGESLVLTNTVITTNAVTVTNYVSLTNAWLVTNVFTRRYYTYSTSIQPMTNVVTLLHHWEYQTNWYPVYHSTEKTYLDVVDYSDAFQPTVRRPVNLPGSLAGVSRNGMILYTHWGRVSIRTEVMPGSFWMA